MFHFFFEGILGRGHRPHASSAWPFKITMVEGVGCTQETNCSISQCSATMTPDKIVLRGDLQFYTCPKEQIFYIF